MPYNKLSDYIYMEFKADVKLLKGQVVDLKKTTLKHGKKFAQNSFTGMKALKELSELVKTFNGLGGNIDDYIELVPDDITEELIYLYEAYRYDIQYSDSSDDDKYFRRVHLVSLVYFSFAYARYNQLDKYLELWLKINPSNTADEAYSTKADAINTFNEQCKKYGTSTDFIRESIKLINPDFNDNSRIKMTKDYKGRKDFNETLKKRHDLQDETNIDKVLKEIDETDRSKFR